MQRSVHLRPSHQSPHTHKSTNTLSRSTLCTRTAAPNLPYQIVQPTRPKSVTSRISSLQYIIQRVHPKRAPSLPKEEKKPPPHLGARDRPHGNFPSSSPEKLARTVPVHHNYAIPQTPEAFLAEVDPRAAKD